MQFSSSFKEYKSWETFGDGLYMSKGIMIDENRLNSDEVEFVLEDQTRNQTEREGIENEMKRLEELLRQNTSESETIDERLCQAGYHQMEWTGRGNGMYVCTHCDRKW